MTSPEWLVARGIGETSAALVEQGEEGEERHLELLRERQSRGVVQGDAATVRDDPVDVL